MAFLDKLYGNPNAVGIDIGSHSIKIVQLTPVRNGFALLRAGSAPTPPGAIKQGVVDDRLAVAEAIDTLMHTLGITTPWAVAAVSAPTVVVRQVRLPAMPEHQLRKSIYWEARNYITFPVEDSLVEFQILGTTSVDGTPQMDVMLVASPRELVDSRTETMEQAGLEPLAIELEPFALMRVAIDLPHGGAGTNETVALVSIGATYTHISIIAGGTFVLFRSVTVAGNSFTEAIATGMGIDTAQAEEIKENEAQAVTDEMERAKLSPVGQEASRAMEAVLEELVREIRRSFAFYDYQQIPGGAPRGSEGITRIYVTGGGSNLPGLIPFLAEQISIPVEGVQLFDNYLIQLPAGAESIVSQTPLLTTAFGLALREPMLARMKGGSR